MLRYRGFSNDSSLMYGPGGARTHACSDTSLMLRRFEGSTRTMPSMRSRKGALKGHCRLYIRKIASHADTPLSCS